MAREFRMAPFHVEDGAIAMPGCPGLGFEPNKLALARPAIAEDGTR